MHLCLHRNVPGVISALIRWQTRGAYSHASFQFSDGVIIEAREFVGVQKLPRLHPRARAHVDLFDILGMTAEKEFRLREWCESQLGKPYDYWSIARFLTREPIHHWQREDWFCSEFCYFGLDHVGLPPLRACPAWKVNPAMLGLSRELIYRRTVKG